ncbi:hypothetical protein, partial [Xanthomonas phaseoli]|uniref:hypothetical protein n=1 Tax=Xanthomonas phaseoli TaxID=1985254 RepID=UPI00126770AB
IPAESARNGEIPKFQKPLFGTTPPSALSGLVVQTFLRSGSQDRLADSRFPIPDFRIPNPKSQIPNPKNQ